MNHLSLVKELVQAYQAFEVHSAAHIKEMGLTTTQFDIVATLGNQPPMTCKELGEKTLVSKGTMTGVLERLEAKGFIEKFMNIEDGRSYKIGLSKSGDKLFKKVFPEHVEYLSKAFGKLSKKELEQAVMVLKEVKTIFQRKDHD
ncbi:MAG: MarR family transcriptional regulator [Polynucleobacter sp. 24-46-87]|jgi:DNA-binding MarR family transcriptional regulator|uniref:MarR family winged helix-turn-helix transcriptional regulator n=1 Tax=unclassified Polynucleobacter TaxID=2640945 RepID=UPI000BDCF7A4|nr:MULTISPECIES: MarR family transcriptional regulator [unclassified Polynucleobacter]OYY21820.1 MAG: MarR family transcriptional regulator [Polynucleobacter sp. 35-46-11]OZA16133.1 MAG: MarR family transcriptional regulator [Polynucleobacter sp. 24-46-87]OZA78530.1 MAG: MarR family transcriptional regulator [Polynucleobacter sp. 39-46-10]